MLEDGAEVVAGQPLAKPERRTKGKTDMPSRVSGKVTVHGTSSELTRNKHVRAAYLGEGEKKTEVPAEQAALLREVSARDQ